jgi:hypothetical protein
MTFHQFPELIWNWLVLNRKPHSNWEDVPGGSQLAVRSSQ